MTDNQNQKYGYYTKVAWTIYYLIAVVLASLLVLFVAQDNEERFFFGIMTIAASYVLRPTEKYLGKLILKFTGVSQSSDN